MAARPSRTPRTLALAAAALAVLLFGIWLGGHPDLLPSSLRSALVQDGKQRLVNEALNMLSRDYYRRVNLAQLTDKGLAAMIASLDDPYSHYYSPTAYRAFLDQSSSHLSGVGISVLPEPGGLRVVEVYPGSPASRAGLARGDLIVRVGSTSLVNRSPDFGSSLIKGRAGTRVRLTLVRRGREQTVSIVRANLVIPVATGNIVTFRGIKIGYLQLTSFTQGSGAELRDATQRMSHAGARALILDLRENGGGLLDEGVNVASLFISDGTIVSTEGRNQPRQVYSAKGGAISTRTPMVVLVDRGTASAAEIVTAALRDRGRAKVVGTSTYGKGVFQEIEPLSNGGALDITVGEYFTPSGRNLGGGGVREGSGIKPDVYALDNPHSSQDEALVTAERTVAAEVP